MFNIDLYGLIIGLPAFFLSLVIHEYAHAKMADKLGDPTPRFMGRLTLDLRAHIDPFGLLALIITRRIGWAKPVPINPNNFQKPRQGMLLVGLAGPLANLLLALVFSLVFRTWSILDPTIFTPWRTLVGYEKIIFDMLGAFYITNIGLAVFNMLPFPPLDGSRVLAGVIPNRYVKYLDYLEGGLGTVILLALVFTNTLEKIIVPIIDFLSGLLLTGL